MLKKICNFLTTVVIVILAVIALILIVPRFLGCQTLAVLSGSMEPGIPVGSIVIVKETEADQLQKDDVITYRLSGDTMVTHRVVENDTETKQLITKGDANDAPDASPVAYTSVVGKKVIHFPLLGYLTIYIKTPLGIAGICGVIVILILLTCLPDIFSKESNDVTDM